MGRKGNSQSRISSKIKKGYIIACLELNFNEYNSIVNVKNKQTRLSCKRSGGSITFDNIYINHYYSVVTDIFR